MNIYEEIKLLNIERNCIRHADVCNRECDKCELVQDTDELLEMYDAVVKNLEKLKEYENLEEQGMLIKLPCKVGDDVYYILGIPNETPCAIDKCTFELSDINKIGKTLFLTREEAEAKLKELRGGENERQTHQC